MDYNRGTFRYDRIHQKLLTDGAVDAYQKLRREGAIKPDESLRVLDLGAGTGRWLVELKAELEKRPLK